MNALSAAVLERPQDGGDPTTTGATPAAEVDCIHWLWPSYAAVDGVDVPHWLIDQEGENK